MHALRTLHLFAGAGGPILTDLLLGHIPVGAVEIDPIASESYQHATQMGHCPGFPSLQMSKHLTGRPGADTSKSSPQAFPAKTSPSRESAQVFLAIAQAYGQSAPVSLGKYDPATHSLRTSQLLLLEASTECLQILPRWGWMDAGAVSGLMMWVPRIRGNDSGYWPTPTTNDAKNNAGPAQHTKGQGGRNLNVVAQQASWEPCLCCEDYWCTIHQEHAFQCPCPEIETWTTESVSTYWQTEPDIRRVVDGMAHRVDRLRALGNGWVPQCAALAWRILTS